MHFLLLALITLPSLVLIDLLWLGVVAKGFYASQVGALMRAQPDLGAAGALYILLACGLTYFAILPGYLSGSLVKTVLTAAAFGFVAYGIYDLTNLATLNGWSLTVSVVDMLWGAFLCAATSAIAFSVMKFFS